MKLLVQSDDYGISKAQAHRCIEGIRNGLIRNTGFFTNMPWAEECAEWIRPYLNQIAFGIDLNITTGKSVLPHHQIPTITKEDNSFISSWESRKMDQTAPDHEHAAYEEVLAEFDAQIRRFIQFVGKKPDYIHSHAYNTPNIMKAHRELATKYELPYSSDVMKKTVGFGIPDYHIEWYQRPSTLENQAASSLKDYILSNGNSWLAEDCHFLIGHMGYVDQELIELTSYTLYRMTDLAGITDPEVLEWVKNSGIELISYKDIC